MISPNGFSSKISLSIKTSESAVKTGFKGNISKVQTICPTLQKETTLIFVSNIFWGATVPLVPPLATAMSVVMCLNIDDDCCIRISHKTSCFVTGEWKGNGTLFKRLTF